jgi:hypothetical protein
MIDENRIYDTIMYARQRYGVPEVEGGWHFSFLGDHKKALTKIQNYGHTEFSHIPESKLEECFKNLQDPLCRNGNAIFSHVDPINLMPEYVQENIQKFNHYLKNV